ncbi:MAG: dihydroorotate dehydrogenase [Provencibacterium sp.]|jgi:dihydroorotate dehydrogenase (NAD+) catalytic subunit|nr:dihydroorotate dehydrogenase [Provencibacterium sp.]
MADLSVKIAGVTFKNPVIAASGCYGFGLEYEDFYPLERLGGVSLKGLTLEKRLGNPPPRIAETPSGMLNSVGLQNPGVDAFLAHDLPKVAGRDTVLIANIAGRTEEDYCALAERLREAPVDLLEVNISCPNVREGGAAFGASCEGAARVVRAVRAAARQPLIVKLSPNVTDIAAVAKAVESEGADGISLINTLLGMRIDIESRRPVLRNNTGGLSGPAVFPVAVRMVWQAAQAVSIPVIGLGGVSTAEDAIEMMLAGASAVQVGAACFQDPFAPVKIIEGMEAWLDAHRIASVSEIVGKVQAW